MDFKDFHDGMQQDHFWIRAKRDFIKLVLDQENIHPSAKILDVGAGVGDDIKVLASFGSIYVIDIDEQVLTYVPRDLVVDARVADICALPYADNFFEVIVCFDVLEHIADDRRAVVELQRVLKPGGKLFFTVPAYQWLFSQHDTHLGHYRRHTKSSIKKLFSGLVFEEKSLSYWFSLLFVPAALQRLLNKKNSEGLKPLGKFLNGLFYAIVACENFLIKCGVRFPFGLSVWGVYCKVDKATNSDLEEISSVKKDRL